MQSGIIKLLLEVKLEQKVGILKIITLWSYITLSSTT